MTDKILKFISNRFPIDCNWLTGNCFYFAQILKSRFPEGEIYYDVIFGHFLFKIYNNYYDWSGKVESIGQPVKWDTFQSEYDSLQYERIIKDCVK